MRNFLEGFLGEFFGRNSLFYFDVEGIDFIVEILVFVKILSQCKKEGRKEGQKISMLRSARASSIALKKC